VFLLSSHGHTSLLTQEDLKKQYANLLLQRARCRRREALDPTLTSASTEQLLEENEEQHLPTQAERKKLLYEAVRQVQAGEVDQQSMLILKDLLRAAQVMESTPTLWDTIREQVEGRT
jgi:hypothetical protein